MREPGARRPAGTSPGPQHGSAAFPAPSVGSLCARVPLCQAPSSLGTRPPSARAQISSEALGGKQTEPDPSPPCSALPAPCHSPATLAVRVEHPQLLVEALEDGTFPDGIQTLARAGRWPRGCFSPLLPPARVGIPVRAQPLLQVPWCVGLFPGSAI